MRLTSEAHNLAIAHDAQGLTSPETFEMEDSILLPEVEQQREQVASPEQPHATRSLARHTLGLLLLLTVVFLWTTSNFLGSSIFADDTYAKPFFLTYLNTSTFILCLVPALVKGAGRPRKNVPFTQQMYSSLSRRRWTAPWRRKPDLTPAETNDEAEAFIKPADDVLLPSEDGNPTQLSISETVKFSLAFCPLWFGANYFAMACLQYTTVASTTILTSTSSMWTLLLGAITGTEKFTWRKFAAVVASLSGIALISQVDLKAHPQTDTPERALDQFPDKTAYELLFGDALALLSAIIYGFYTITLKRTTLAVEPRSLHMPTFFGLVGLFNVFLLLPAFPVLHFTGLEKFSVPPTPQIWAILLINSVSSLLSDIAWAYAMIFTSPLVVTVGLSLTIPLSLIGEMIIQGRFESWIYWIGAAIVVGSFIFVERDEKQEEDAVELAKGKPSDTSFHDHEHMDESGLDSAPASHSGSNSRHRRSTSLLDDEDEEQSQDMRESLDQLSVER